MTVSFRPHCIAITDPPASRCASTATSRFVLRTSAMIASKTFGRDLLAGSNGLSRFAEHQPEADDLRQLRAHGGLTGILAQLPKNELANQIRGCDSRLFASALEFGQLFPAELGTRHLESEWLRGSRPAWLVPDLENGHRNPL